MPLQARSITCDQSPSESAHTGRLRFTCRRCGISRPTLRLWARRYAQHGELGLIGLSRRPHRSPRQKLGPRERELILSCRRLQNLGARRIQIELRLAHELEISITTIQKALNAAAVSPLRKPRRVLPAKRYSRPVPGCRASCQLGQNALVRKGDFHGSSGLG
ncbi:MAG: helix-turn-helix domain-containing protein [Gemmatimonadaceae bacterium]|nr:helix-turn-helix domain-containing protein [Gemmatimonadaceae bacterium]